ncbi:MAG: hypothetical protein K2X91_07850, partial [Thermoleophilia bacterium]|nr:hypothetical protein [Thermoleophilia bacterium]
MVTILLAALLGLSAVAPPDDATLAAYAERRAKTPADAESQVALARWCDENGLKAERDRHLALAILKNPAHAAAREMLGLPPRRAASAPAQPPPPDPALAAKLAEYNARRARIDETPDAHWKLGLWCDENGLEAEAKVHFTAVVELDPSREAAWKRLGYRKAAGRWVTAEQESAEKQEAALQKAADRKWKPLMEKWRGWLVGKDEAKRDEAARLLAEVSDPRAVDTIWRFFVEPGPRHHRLAVEVFGRIE